MNIREWKFERIKKQQPARQIRFPHWDSVRRVMLLYDADAEGVAAAIEACRKRLEKEGKEALSMGVSLRKEVPASDDYDWILGKKDFTLWHSPKKEIGTQLKEQKFDLLLDLSQTTTLQARYVALLCQADFKVGRTDKAEQTDGVHDLMIQTESQADPTFLFEQSIHYLKLIKSND